MNRKLARTGFVKDGGPPRCPECAQRLAFGTDRLGRTTESCGCGHRAYVQVREGERRDPLSASALPDPTARGSAMGPAGSVTLGSKREA